MALALAVAALGLSLAACGSDERSSAEAPGVGQVRAGSVAALANCGDWRRGSVAERLATIEDLNTGAVEGGEGVPPFSDEDAYDFFERACAPDYAAGFKLYKLYARGAAFSALQP
jgi:hypothetical protein